MRSKRLLAVLLAGCMLTTSLAACGGDSKSGEKTTGDTGGDAVKLSAIFNKHPLTKPLAEMEWLQQIEKDAGVKVDWQEISADWNQKKATLLASGDVPDMIFGPGSVNSSDFAQFNGLFADLSELIEANAPNIKKMFEEKPELKGLATELNGQINGLPKYQRFWPDTVTRQYINKTWLDNLGLKEPTNWDELYTVLKAFKEQDANGNGDATDEIPFDFAPATEGFGGFTAQYLLCSTGITLSENSGDGIFLEDKKIKNFFTDERWKETITFYQKLYSEGLISSEAFTQDYSKYQSVARGEGKNAKVGFTWGWEIMDRVGTEISDQYVTLAPMKNTADSTVDPSWSYNYNDLNYGANMVSVSAACKNKEKAVEFIDKFYDPEVSLQVLFGSVGPNIEKASDGSYKILPPTDSALDPGTWKWTSSFADNGPMYIADSLQVTLGEDMISNENQTAVMQPTIDKIDQDNDVLPRMFIKMSTEDNNELTLARTNVIKLAFTKWAQWVTEGGIDKEWDQYVKDMDSAGINTMTDIWQKYYDEYNK